MIFYTNTSQVHIKGGLWITAGAIKLTVIYWKEHNPYFVLFQKIMTLNNRNQARKILEFLASKQHNSK